MPTLFFHCFIIGLKTTFLNPFATAFAIVFGLHLFVARGNTKLVFPIIFACINVYMFLALFSEFREFSSISEEAMIMMVVGVLYLGLNLAGAVILIINARRMDHIQLEIAK